MKSWRKVKIGLGVLSVLLAVFAPGFRAEGAEGKARAPSEKQFKAQMRVRMRQWLAETAQSYAARKLGDKPEERRKEVVEAIVKKYMEVVGRELTSKEFAFVTWEGKRLRDPKQESTREGLLKAATSRKPTGVGWVFELEFLCEADAIAFAAIREVEPFLQFLLELPYERTKEGQHLGARDYLFSCIVLGEQVRKGLDILEELPHPLASSSAEPASEKLSRKFASRAKDILAKRSDAFKSLAEEIKREFITRYGEALAFTEADSERTVKRIGERDGEEKPQWKANRYAYLIEIPGVLPSNVDTHLRVRKFLRIRKSLIEEYKKGEMLSDTLGLELLARELWLEATGFSNARRVAMGEAMRDPLAKLAQGAAVPEAGAEADPSLDAEMSESEAAAIEEFRAIRKRIEDGERFEDVSTPTRALLTFASALRFRDKGALDRTSALDLSKMAHVKITEEQLAKWEEYFGKHDVLRAPPPAESPSEGDIWPVYASEMSGSELADTHLFVFSGGKWLRLGNMGSATDWRDFVPVMKGHLEAFGKK